MYLSDPTASLESVARTFNVTGTTLYHWVDKFHARVKQEKALMDTAIEKAKLNTPPVQTDFMERKPQPCQRKMCIVENKGQCTAHPNIFSVCGLKTV